jgi:polyhydroxyalkanoate synthesis repressor PhaR
VANGAIGKRRETGDDKLHSAAHNTMSGDLVTEHAANARGMTMPTTQAASRIGAADATATDIATPPVTIKKYANRRLYNTATSSYVTLDSLCQMVKNGVDFVVYDAKTGEDITRAVLTQIIVEEEGKGQTMLPIGFLRQLISLYGDNLQFMVPRYLEQAMQSFAHNQDQMRSYFKDTMSGMFSFGAIEEMSKQNMAIFERAMQMFSPFNTPSKNAPAAQPEPASAAAPTADGYALLQKRLDDLQRQLDKLDKAGKE